jgi:hypothetical protein
MKPLWADFDEISRQPAPAGEADIAYLLRSIGGTAPEVDFDSTAEVAGKINDYELGRNMPGAVPFASNGGGEWLLFDAREGLVHGEYPILYVSEGGSLFHGAAKRIADSFEDLCRGSSQLDNAMKPTEILEPESIDVVIVQPPPGGLPALSKALRELGIVAPTSELRSYLEGLPKPLLRGVEFYPFSWKVAKLNEGGTFLEIIEHVGKRRE